MRKEAYWSPYLAGAGIGLALLAAYCIMGWGLGASSAFSLLSSAGIRAVSPGALDHLPYFSQYANRLSPFLDWYVIEIGGVFSGALVGSLVSRNFRFRFEQGGITSPPARLMTALAGGILMGFAARLARGCTSGVALSGGAQLAVAGWVFVIMMFAGGFLARALFRRLWSS